MFSRPRLVLHENSRYHLRISDIVDHDQIRGFPVLWQPFCNSVNLVELDETLAPRPPSSNDAAAKEDTKSRTSQGSETESIDSWRYMTRS